MKIKVVNSIPDDYRGGLPNEMLGQKYQVLKLCDEGAWVKNGKLEVLVLFEELELVEISELYKQVFLNYLKKV
ncbi:hypothetical protein M3181_03610 [Mesobacillus maritimus]|uniref:hypothetical protein n=1 Tax=Mesobacillus maritimus TaxID=1643336 RepID=UPI00203FF5F0|nr:hypothetical protein [Mesobacillus maritimus]MCM3668088.1 hypothetical protein [Mesobacillus maritimus]